MLNCCCSVSDVMVPTAVSSALLTTTNHRPNTTLVNYAIPFSNPIVTPTIPGTYSAATYTYTCIQSGPYLFSVSAAVPGKHFSYPSVYSILSWHVLLERKDMTRVIQGITQFYLNTLPNTSYMCLYSAGAQHHRPLVTTPVLLRVGG